LLLDVRPTAGGVPTESDIAILASATISASLVSDGSVSFVTVDISSFHVNVTPGEQLAIVLRSPSDSNYDWVGQSNEPSQPSPYRGVYSFLKPPPLGAGRWPPFPSDLGGPVVPQSLVFEPFVTAPGAAPEPASLILLAIGSVALAGHRWRRRKPAVPLCTGLI